MTGPEFTTSNWKRLVSRLDPETGDFVYTETLKEIENDNPELFEQQILPILQIAYNHYAEQPPYILRPEHWDTDMTYIDREYFEAGLDEFFIARDIFETTLRTIQDQNPNLFITIILPLLELQYISNNQNINYSNNNSNNYNINNNNANYMPQTNYYAKPVNIGTRNIPKNATNAISFEPIENNTNMINFHDEFSHGRYYTKNTFNKLALKNGKKENPYTKQKINASNAKKYKSHLVGGGKTRKRHITKKSKKTRKH